MPSLWYFQMVFETFWELFIFPECLLWTGVYVLLVNCILLFLFIKWSHACWIICTTSAEPSVCVWGGDGMVSFAPHTCIPESWALPGSKALSSGLCNYLLLRCSSCSSRPESGRSFFLSSCLWPEYWVSSKHGMSISETLCSSLLLQYSNSLPVWKVLDVPLLFSSVISFLHFLFLTHLTFLEFLSTLPKSLSRTCQLKNYFQRSLYLSFHAICPIF